MTLESIQKADREMNAQVLIDTAKMLVAGDKVCWRWMKVMLLQQTICQIGDSPERADPAHLAELIVTTPGLVKASVA